MLMRHKKILALLSVVVFMFHGAVMPVFALTDEQKKTLDSNVRYFNVDEDELCGSSGSSAQSNQSGVNTPGGVFIVGDSISAGLRDSNKLNLPVGWNVSFSAQVGRPLSPTGLSEIKNNATVRDPNTKAVVIELGTNDPDSISSHLSEAVDAVHSLNAQAKVYWVNLAAHAPSRYDAPFAAANQIIQGQAGAKNYQVIDWAAIASPFLGAGDVHVNDDSGNEALAKLITDSVTGGSASGSTGGSAACCGAGSGSVALVGSENAEKAYNFFVGKGLSAIQAVGIMGNLEAESTIDPTQVEAGNGIGYGIAQWSFGRRTDLENAAKAKGVPVADLGFQLEYLYNESTQRDSRSYPGTNEIEGLKKQTTVRDAVFYWEDNHERPAVSHQEIRVQFGNDFLARFGSNSGGAGSGGAATGGCSGGSGGNFNFGKYAGMSRQQLIALIYNAPNWKPQGPNPAIDIDSGAAQDNLLRLLAALLESLPNELITPSVIRTGHSCNAASGNISNHAGGLAVDLGNAGHSQESMNNIFNWLYTNHAALSVDELIFEPPPAGTSTLKHGEPLVYDGSTREAHANHIHVSVEGPAPTSCPPGS